MAQRHRDKRDEAFIRAFGGGMAATGTNKSRFAQKLNISRCAIYGWHKSPGTMSLSYLRILARELNFTDEEILKIVR